MMRIMINNINVADCEFRGYCNICKLKSGSNYPTDCRDYPNCHYKNWQRKEQECEELKDLNTRLDNQRETYWKEYQKLKVTLTEIKEIAETQRRYIDDIKGFMFDDKIVEWKSAYIDFSSACRRLNQQILQKISEVVE